MTDSGYLKTLGTIFKYNLSFFGDLIYVSPTLGLRIFQRFLRFGIFWILLEKYQGSGRRYVCILRMQITIDSNQKTDIEYYLW